MSAIDECFDECLEAAAEEKGGCEKVLFRGRSLDALFFETPTEIQIIAGGNADSGLSTVGLRKSDVLMLGDGGGPQVGESIKIRGKQCSVKMSVEKESCFMITSGSFSSEDR